MCGSVCFSLGMTQPHCSSWTYVAAQLTTHPCRHCHRTAELWVRGRSVSRQKQAKSFRQKSGTRDLRIKSEQQLWYNGSFNKDLDLDHIFIIIHMSNRNSPKIFFFFQTWFWLYLVVLISHVSVNLFKHFGFNSLFHAIKQNEMSLTANLWRWLDRRCNGWDLHLCIMWKKWQPWFMSKVDSNLQDAS